MESAMKRMQKMGAILLVLGLTSCDLSRQATHYRIRIHCQLPDGSPVAGVKIGKAVAMPPLLASDAQGNLVLPIDGREGQEVPFAIVHIPPSLVLAEGGESRRVILKNYGVRGRQQVSEVMHEIRLRPKKETYVVLVTAEQAPMLAVAANGAVVAHLNSRSAAAFRTEGKPGEELKVTLLASKVAKVQDSDPTETFTLPENGAILAFRSNLLLKPPPVAKVRTGSRPALLITPWDPSKLGKR